MAMHSRSIIALTLVPALVLGACSGGAAGTPEPAAQVLEGRTFLSTGAEGRALVAGSTVRLTFRDGGVQASAGCNSMAGPYRIDGGRLIADRLATTEMACDPALMEQDRWLADLLNGATIGLDGDTLTLTKGINRLTLLDREVADPDRPLAGTRWVVDGLVSGGSVASVPAGVVAALTFGDGRVDVEAGCNTGGGGIRVTGTTIEVGPVALTKMACEPARMAVEQAIVTVLSGTVGYTIEAGTLTLDAGGVGLTLRATP
jgi:heat shock protein HslJ